MLLQFINPLWFSSGNLSRTAYMLLIKYYHSYFICLHECFISAAAEPDIGEIDFTRFWFYTQDECLQGL